MGTYLVKRNPNCEGEANWIFMTGKEFYKFVTSPEAKGRYFIDLDNMSDIYDDSITIEASKDQYMKWRTEKRHKQHLTDSKKESKIKEIYFDEWNSLVDENTNIEGEVERKITCQRLDDALCTLSLDERWLIDEIYVYRHTEEDIAMVCGVSQQAISKRKNKIIKKLKIVGCET